MNPSNQNHQQGNPSFQQIEVVLKALATLYDKELTAEAIKLYVSILHSVNYAEIKKAAQLWIADSSNKKFPLPAELLSMVRHTDDEMAQQIAARIKVGIRKYGATYPEILKRAENYIGPIGWQLVQQEGGWDHLITANFNIDYAEHDWKKKIKLILKNNRLGNINKSAKVIDLSNQDNLKQIDVNVRDMIPNFNFK